MNKSKDLRLLLFICFCFMQGQFGVCYRSEVEISPAPTDEATTQKSGFFSGIKNFFSGSPQTTTTTTTTPRIPIQGTFNAPRPPPLTISTAPLMPLGPRPDTPLSSPLGGQPNQPPQWPRNDLPIVSTSTTLRPQSAAHSPAPSQQTNLQNINDQQSGSQKITPGFAPYRPQISQPSGFALSYGDGNTQVRPTTNGYRPGSNLVPLTTSTTTTTTTKKPLQPQHHSTGSSSPTHAKEDFPPLPSPPRPSIGGRYDTPASPSSLPSSPSVWNTTPASSRSAPANTSPAPLPTTSQRPNSPSTPVNHNTRNGVSFIPSTVIRRPSSANNQQLASDDEIQQLTENMYAKEGNSQLAHIQVNIQGKTRSIDSGDEAPIPLLAVESRALEVATIAKLRALFNNYEVDTLVNEHVSANERKEENDFLDVIMATNVMRQAMIFLQNKGIVTTDPQTHRDLVKEIWFTQYSRGSGKVGSSGFEHVFVNEVKNGTIIGLHNWVYFYEEEQAGRLDYKGYMKSQDIGTKGKILKARFTHNGLNKPVNTLFIGTSPELELALYTVCFKLRPDRTCPVSLGSSKFGIVTYTWRYRGKNLIGSAYPEI